MKESGDFLNDSGLRFHKYVHFMQQRKLGFSNFYSKILKEYYQSGKGIGKWFDSYGTPGHWEFKSEMLEKFFKYLLPFK